jgi:hypothetical protein
MILAASPVTAINLQNLTHTIASPPSRPPATGRFRPIGCDNRLLLANPAEAGISAGHGGTFPAASFSSLAGLLLSCLFTPKLSAGGCGRPFSPRPSRSAWTPAGSRLVHQSRVVDAAPDRQVGRCRSGTARREPVAGSGSAISAPCSSISRASRIRPRRSQRRQRISSRSSRSTRSPSVTTNASLPVLGSDGAELPVLAPQVR